MPLAGSPMQPDADPQATPTERHADLDVVRRALAGDPDASEQLIRWLERLPAMIRVRADSTGLDEDRLADVIQEGLATAWRRIESFEGRSSFATWLYGIGSNQVLKALEADYRRQREAGGVALDEFAGAAPEEPDGDEVALVVAALDGLDPVCREVVRLKHYDSLTFEEIGDRRDLPVGSVKSIYYRGLSKLRARLSGYRRTTQ